MYEGHFKRSSEVNCDAHTSTLCQTCSHLGLGWYVKRVGSGVPTHPIKEMTLRCDNEHESRRGSGVGCPKQPPPESVRHLDGSLRPRAG